MMLKIQERMISVRQKRLCFSLIFFIVMLSLSQQAFAEELKGTTREEVLTYLQEAFDAQVSLTEKARSQNEIKQILSTYLEEELIEKYMEENVHKIDEKFIVYGTDFPMHTIPFFTYDENTKVIEQANERIVFEFFPASTDGPVSYDDHYEVVKMRNTSEGWKVYSIENQTNKPDFIEEQKTSRKDQKQLSSALSLDVISTDKNQSIKEINEMFFFSTIYLQTKNILNEYFLSKVSFINN